MPTETRISDPDASHLRLQHTRFGVADLSTLTLDSLLSRRSPRLIRQSDPERLQLGVITGGRQGIEQAGNTAWLTAGDLVVYDSSQPFDAYVDAAAGGASNLVLQFPKKLLPIPADRLRCVLAVPLSARSGTGRLLAQFLVGLTEEREACSPTDQARLAGVAIDLTTAVLGHYLADDRVAAPPTRRHSLFLEIGAFIHRHLAEPLAPREIALAHRISVRHLQRVFREHGWTVTDYVREQRINRCRRDLADPALDHIPVHRIGARWGFPQPADFSRSFRKATGVSPGRYRSLARKVEHLRPDNGAARGGPSSPPRTSLRPGQPPD
jgi:AraC-like DNA-binding protein